MYEFVALGMQRSPIMRDKELITGRQRLYELNRPTSKVQLKRFSKAEADRSFSSHVAEQQLLWTLVPHLV